MLDTGLDAKAAWVGRVLGINVESAPAAKPTPTQAGAPQQSFVNMQKSRLLWVGARQKVASQIDQLKKAIAADFMGDPDEDAILDEMDALDNILVHMDERLVDVLDDLLDEKTSEEERASLIVNARGLLGEYVNFLMSDPLLKKLEGDAPFGVHLSVASTMTSTLKSLSAALH